MRWTNTWAIGARALGCEGELTNGPVGEEFGLKFCGIKGGMIFCGFKGVGCVVLERVS